MKRKAKEQKWINGIREVLWQVLILVSVGSLFIFLPLKGNMSTAQAGLPDSRTLSEQLGRTGLKGELENFGSWLTHSMNGPDRRAKGPAGGND